MDGSQQAANTSGLTVRQNLPHRLQREWERWDSETLQDQKLMYRKKWEIMRHSKQPLFPFQFRHIPWPIFRSGEIYPEINTPSVEYFTRHAVASLRLYGASIFNKLIRSRMVYLQSQAAEALMIE
ncbi:hypothetical protein B0H14DRAFT_2572435 [Mycena olivaceomarginata]|nr:hypothetical protein B0H14DRAFT_2572435 [Mycena olivaceomarginata]